MGRLSPRRPSYFALAAILACATALLPSPGWAQTSARETLEIDARSARTWTDDRGASILLLDGVVTFRSEDLRLYAERAVVWFTQPGGDLTGQVAEIALIGNAKVEQSTGTRSGDRMIVTLPVRGSIRVNAQQRLAVDDSGSDLFRTAVQLRSLPSRPEALESPVAEPGRPAEAELTPAFTAATLPTTRPAPAVNFQARDIETRIGPDGNMIVLLSGGVSLLQSRDNGDFIELLAERVVLFTPLKDIAALEQTDRIREIQQAVTSAYLEGDVRINFTPGLSRQGQLSDQRLQAERVYYEFATDRAVLTDAVLHTYDPQRQIPIVLRAQTVRQLAIGEFNADKVELTTSTFAVPSYSVRATKAYVRQYDTGDARLGNRTVFSADHATFNTFGVPVFYLPGAGGSMTDRGSALRELQFGGASGFGPSIRTKWGLFETLGQAPPDGLDAAYRLDYFADRGPGAGFDFDYDGGYITQTTRQPWNFEGGFTSYGVLDDGEDRLGKDRQRIQHDDEFRGRVQWQHQHFFPGDYQVQLRAGAVTDPTFLEEYFEQQFDTGLPTDVSAYVKRQRGSEAITFLISYQPSDLVTTADLLQENFEVERWPEVGYRRIGDSWAGDQLTFFSENTLAFQRFEVSYADLDEEWGFNQRGDKDARFVGIPSLGQTGTPSDLTFRGDFRQELDWPVYGDGWNFVPFVMARYTGYSDSPEDGTKNRIIVGTGARVGTVFWKVYDGAESELFDVHRMRHVIEPQAQLFASISNEDRDDLLIYDESIDAVNDVSGFQIALRQRWQTKRGGPGRWRSVDFLSFNLEGNFFFNTPDELAEVTIDDDTYSAKPFRGLYFYTMPEASLPRTSLNADATWRMSDTTVLLSDMQWNMEEFYLATTSVGLAARRDPRVTWFTGLRYIGVVHSTIATVAFDYKLTPKYSLAFAQAFDLAENGRNSTNVTVTRRFDRFFVTVSFVYDDVEDSTGVRFGIFPEGLGYGLQSDQLGTAFGGR